MSDRLSSVDLLRSTAYIASLARRAAMESNNPAVREKALKLAPIARELKQLADAPAVAPVVTPGVAPLAPMAAPAPVTTVDAPDFQALVTVASKKLDPKPEAPTALTSLKSDSMDRIGVALSMAQGGANGVEIAKSLGLTRAEVDLILNIASQK